MQAAAVNEWAASNFAMLKPATLLTSVLVADQYCAAAALHWEMVKRGLRCITENVFCNKRLR
jgi:hypothetical protein